MPTPGWLRMRKEQSVEETRALTPGWARSHAHPSLLWICCQKHVLHGVGAHIAGDHSQGLVHALLLTFAESRSHSSGLLRQGESGLCACSGGERGI